METNQHVTKKSGKWRVIGEGNSRATKKFTTQKDAIDYGRKIAINQQAELVIHGVNDRIRDKDSYGSDPIPPRDTRM